MIYCGELKMAEKKLEKPKRKSVGFSFRKKKKAPEQVVLLKKFLKLANWMILLEMSYKLLIELKCKVIIDLFHSYLYVFIKVSLCWLGFISKPMFY